MSRTNHFILIFGLLLVLFSGLASTQAATFGNFTFTHNGYVVTISGYPTGASGAVVIPPSINGLPVEVIGFRAFAGCADITSITIPSSVTTIGNEAFSSCARLSQLTIPSGVRTIGNSAFLRCYGLSSMTLPASVTTLGTEAFHECNNLTTAVLSEQISNLRAGTFKRCIRLKSVSLPPMLRSIDGSAFEDCKALVGVTLPNSLWSVGDAAFKSCSALENIALPSGLLNIGAFAFSETKIRKITIPSGVPAVPVSAFESNTQLTTVIVQEGVRHVEANAFAGCMELSSVTLPDSLTTIGSYAFYNTSLASIKIPGQVGTVGEYAFYGSYYLTTATFLGNAPIMGEDVFLDTATAFSVRYYDGKKGFASPKWLGYPAVKIGPEISVLQPRELNLKDGVSKKSFAQVKVGKSGTAKTFTVKNEGTMNLSGLSITKNGAHAKDFLIRPLAKSSLAPGKSATFTVTFKPKAKGNRQAAIHIKSNDMDESSFDIQLSGQGTK